MACQLGILVSLIKILKKEPGNQPATWEYCPPFQQKKRQLISTYHVVTVQPAISFKNVPRGLAAMGEHYSPLSFKMCQLVPATWEHCSPTPNFHKNAPIDVYLSRGNSAPPPTFLKNAPTGVYLPRGNTKLHFLLFIIMAFRLITHFLSKQTNLRKIQKKS